VTHRWIRALAARLDASVTRLNVALMDQWTKVLRGYRRPLARLTLWLKFAFYPLLAFAAIGWLAWDWTHARSLDAAEDAIFDQVLQWRPLEPKPSGRTVIVEIDDCSIDHFRNLGEGGWPWSRERHADLLDNLDRAGVRAAAFDVIFADASLQDPQGDALLEAMAEAGDGRFLFASSRMHPDFDAQATLTADAVPGAFALAPAAARPGPAVALMLPYGKAMAANSGLVNVARAGDGVLRDVRLYQDIGGWALPALPLRLALLAEGHHAAAAPELLRINWRTRSQLPYVSAADVIERRPVCQPEGAAPPSLDGAVALIGYTAAGINDAKPTPVNGAMPGVEVLAEATEALITGSAIRMPPTWLKYVLAALATLLVTFVFWRGEPHKDVDSVFVAVNATMLLAAFAGLTFFGVFLDIFASVAFISLCFGLCRMYTAIQRGRADGNSDYMRELDTHRYPWLLVARLRLAPVAGLDPVVYKRKRREYRRALRRFVYTTGDIVMVEGIVERKSWLNALLDDLMLLVWKGTDEADVRAQVRRGLDALYAEINAINRQLDDTCQVRICMAAARIGDEDRERERLQLRALLGQDFNQRDEWPLTAANTCVQTGPEPDGDDACATG
jgi:CHASE2 domain-containing sensor protein